MPQTLTGKHLTSEQSVLPRRTKSTISATQRGKAAPHGLENLSFFALFLRRQTSGRRRLPEALALRNLAISRAAHLSPAEAASRPCAADLRAVRYGCSTSPPVLDAASTRLLDPSPRTCPKAASSSLPPTSSGLDGGSGPRLSEARRAMNPCSSNERSVAPSSCPSPSGRRNALSTLGACRIVPFPGGEGQGRGSRRSVHYARPRKPHGCTHEPPFSRLWPRSAPGHRKARRVGHRAWLLSGHRRDAAARPRSRSQPAQPDRAGRPLGLAAALIPPRGRIALFQDDHEDGSLEVIVLGPLPLNLSRRRQASRTG